MILILAYGLISCESENRVIFQIDDVTIKQEGVDKPNVKSTIEFISIAYSDIFEETIDATTLSDLSVAYAAFGDSKLVEQLIIKNFLNDANALIPSNTEMRADLPGFIQDTYRKFYTRDPSEFESWFMEKLINEDQDLTPELIYYSFMASNEYRAF